MNSLLLRFTVAALALSAVAGPGFAQQGESRMTSLNLSNDEPIQIESDKLEVRDNDRMAIFTGNVSVVQGQTLMKAGKMTVYYVGQQMARGANNSEGEQPAAQPASTGGAGRGSADIERIEVDGKVYVKSESQVATGDRANFDMKSEVLTLSGKEVVLTEGENVIVGCKLTVQMRSGQAQLDGCGGTESGGRVKMLLQPGSQNR
jgi:lipopolysaccharide export system protein LptA